VAIRSNWQPMSHSEIKLHVQFVAVMFFAANSHVISRSGLPLRSVSDDDRRYALVPATERCSSNIVNHVEILS
jgi:hypothetical protein